MANEPSTINAATSLETRVLSKGYTPSTRDAEALFGLLGAVDRDRAAVVESAMARMGTPVVPLVLARFPQSVAPLRGRLIRLASRVTSGNPELRALYLAALEDDDGKTRRNAAMALGKESGDDVEAALLAALRREEGAEYKRSICASLGKMGGEKALGALRNVAEVNADSDAELARIVQRGILMLERTHGRTTPSRINLSQTAGEPVRMVLRCRNGLESVLADELAKGFSPRIMGPGTVVANLRGTIASIFVARTFLTFGFELPSERLGPKDSLADAIVRALSSDIAVSIFKRFTDGPIRYRLAFDGGGHRRALVWECASRVVAARPEIVNDPTQSIWEVFVSEGKGLVDIELRPRAFDDPRFTYRAGDVPAASHPTIAAALARVAGVRDDDVVWDPFVGSGSELVERARLGRFKALIGSDMDPKALDVARGNLEAAGVQALLELGDARTFAPRAVTLVLTNPPMGRRVVHHAELGALLQTFIEHVGKMLRPGARLVWISPAGARTAKWAKESGFALDFAQSVDMGGFTAQIQRFVRLRDERQPRLELPVPATRDGLRKGSGRGRGTR